MSLAAVNTDQLKTIGIAAVVVLVVLGVLLSFVISKIIGKIIAIVVFFALSGAVWQQRSALIDDLKQCKAPTFFSFHPTLPKSVTDHCPDL
jgi:protein-S-isoprenylcysteine O-methyltransferase Ste14